MRKHIQTIIPGKSMPKGGCGECHASCQSACKTSCTVGNQACKQKS
ncbi:MAG: six-cysteine ranthipeptide SCIFF [Bacillota bacterium]